MIWTNGTRRVVRFATVTLGAVALTIGLLYLGLRDVAQPAFSVLYGAQLPAGTADAVELAIPNEALSFARMRTNDGPAVLVVTSYQAGTQ